MDTNKLTSVDYNITKFKNCYGCGVCVNICPVKIIKFQENSDGFYKPIIFEQDKCIKCGLCLKTCAFNYKENLPDRSPKSYAAWSNDEKVRKLCSSGGIGFEIGCLLFKKEFHAIGVTYDPTSNRAFQFLADSKDSYWPSTGSKYIQSNPINAFSSIDLNLKYVITGPPCQIDSLRRYVKIFKKEENFVLIDFFCHGFPSLLLWDKYSKEVSKKVGKINSVIWRDKKEGWHESCAMNISSDNKTYFSKQTSGDIFYRFFLGNLCLNKCCYKDCKYKLSNSCADIRIGDFWGTTFKKNELGVSAVLSFTEKGDQIIKQLSEKECHIIEESISNIFEGQMKKNPAMPKNYIYVIKGLKSKISLKTLARIIDLISGIKYRLKKFIKGK